ncbi:FusB/FusC family EF-G-binding protein [Cytobacillus sp. NCCP-133]|uniref:FusB/FusC family EF-G-binding protein n=1 Tax=Cytobacillus sp. NCCP-133 TaxID=766848 RepID=UPI00222FA0B9|nr:FusB/FusC family EF-G-binding protein [Cytobacillus sp. NCCP-133]GLB58712.1 elongation factor G-binding protein [Cytobacillus sp. NCCP-133]
METFIRSDQYNFIRAQTQVLINAHASVNDTGVLNALKALSIEKVFSLFDELGEEQVQLLSPVRDLKERDQADAFLTELKEYVIPFKTLNEQSIKKLFPKAKKLKLPVLDHIDFRGISYLGWNDNGTNRKYMISQNDGKLSALHGTFKPISKKGICTICNKFEEIGMFLYETKGPQLGTYTKKGNYICQDSQKCNHNLISLDQLNDFIGHLNG